MVRMIQTWYIADVSKKTTHVYVENIAITFQNWKRTCKISYANRLSRRKKDK